MGTFSSETSANMHNSDKIETLIALQDEPTWLFLHSLFSKFPRTPIQEDIHGEILDLIILSNLCVTTPSTHHIDAKKHC